MTEKVGTNTQKKLNHLEQRQDKILKKLDKIANQLGVNQPSKELKVTKTVTDSEGNKVEKRGCEAVGEILEKVKSNGRMETPQVHAILEKHGYKRSRKSVLNKMRLMGEKFDFIKYSKSPNKSGKPHKLVKDS